MCTIWTHNWVAARNLRLAGGRPSRQHVPIEGRAMKRRDILGHGGALAGLCLTAISAGSAWALTLDDLSSADMTKGLKAALEKGATTAVGLLGVTDGFMGNERVRIDLPASVQDAAKLLRTFGQGDRVDALLLAMNRAAEAAVPMAKDLLVGCLLYTSDAADE